MRRALETTLIAFDPCISRGLRILALPLAQEATSEISDTGSDVPTLTALFDHHVDFRYLTPGWNDKSGDMATDVTSTKARARKLRGWIKGRGEREAVLVSHGRFAHFLTGDVDENGEQTTGYWGNDELRSFRFLEDGEGDGEGVDAIRETEESRLRRQRVVMEKGEGDVLAD